MEYVLASIVLLTSISLLAALMSACSRVAKARPAHLGNTAKAVETAGTTVSVGVKNLAPTPLSAVEVKSLLPKEPVLAADAPYVTLPKDIANLDLTGMRSSPTMRYSNEDFEFTLDRKGDARSTFARYGCANTHNEQALDPFFAANKMALPDSSNNPSALTTLVRQAPYFHNSCVDTLKKVARFSLDYDRRLTKLYRTNADGRDVAYNALPAEYYGKLVRSWTFAGGYVPSNSDIADILTFLKTHQSC